MRLSLPINYIVEPIAPRVRLLLGVFIMTTAQFFNIIPEDDDRVPGSERLDKASFELMSFCKLEAGRLCWFYLGGAYASA